MTIFIANTVNESGGVICHSTLSNPASTAISFVGLAYVHVFKSNCESVPGATL